MSMLCFCWAGFSQSRQDDYWGKAMSMLSLWGANIVDVMVLEPRKFTLRGLRPNRVFASYLLVTRRATSNALPLRRVWYVLG